MANRQREREGEYEGDERLLNVASECGSSLFEQPSNLAFSGHFE